MRTVRYLALLAVAGFVPTAQAALWSVSNGAVRAGDKTTLLVSFTGDGVAAGAQVDLTIPRGFAVAGARGINGGQCNVLPNAAPNISPDVVRVLTPITWGALPARATSLCEVVAADRSGYSDWFRLSADLCVDGAARGYACTLDPGYVIVVP